MVELSSSSYRHTEVTHVANRVINFSDYHLLSTLFGEADCFLKQIEYAFEAIITVVYNQVAIAVQSEENADLVVKVIHDLYSRLQQGHPLETRDVSGAISMVLDIEEKSKKGLVENTDDVKIITPKRQIRPYNLMQNSYIQAMRKFDLTFGLGPAGTGKTYLAVALAVERLMTGKIDRVILSRPAVEAGENLGFLPGDLREKIDPYLRPLYDALYDNMSVEMVEKKIELRAIEIAPIAFMRGRTLTNAMIIVDEGQNMSSAQMKMLLTRIGEGSQMVINGDLSQMDLPKGTLSGLKEATYILQDLQACAFIRFSNKDIVRHNLVGQIVDAYERYGKKRDNSEQKSSIKT